MKDLKNKTGERVLPGEVSSEYDHVIFWRHLFAYETAMREIPPGGVILDLGCGEGYGTSLLSPAASRVYGLDVDAQAVQHAALKYSCDNCDYRVYDGFKIPFPDGTFDAIVSFQVIEHIEDDHNFVAELSRVMKQTGASFISTPNRSYRLKPGMKPWNRFHVREYHADDLEALLHTGFGDVKVWGIRANEEIQNMEITRARQNLKIAALDPLNLRRLLPEAIVPAVIRFVRKLIYRDPGDMPNEDFSNKYSSNDFYVIKDRLQESLDLFAVCRK